MAFLLPTKQAEKLVMGSDALMVLDVLPDRPISATVSFVSPTVQFTPKEVETRKSARNSCFASKRKGSCSFAALREQSKDRLTGYRVCETRTRARMADKPSEQLC